MRIVGLRKLLGMLLGVGVLGVIAPAVANASVVFNVNTTDDANLTPSNSLVCTANTDSGTKCTLRAAIQATNNQPSGTQVTINVPPGHYQLTATDSVASGHYLNVNNPGPLKIVGAGAAKTIVDPNFHDRAFFIDASGSPTPSVTISGMTIENGRPGGSGTGCPSGSANGGGIDQERGVLTLSHDVVTHNAATGEGGGIFNDFADALILTHTTVSHNKTCSQANGGGVDSFGGGQLTIARSEISGNSAAGDGGGVAEDESSGTITITDTTISGNTAVNGGGITAEAGGAFTLFGDLLSRNTASGDGGGFSDTGGDTDKFTNTTIAQNNASNGGGIFSRFGDETISFSTVTNNTASSGTGNLAEAPFDRAPITQPAAEGFTLDDSIVARGTGTAEPNCNGPAAFSDNDYNMFDDDTGDQCGTPAGAHDVITSALKLGSLAHNGGPTETEALLTGSPAIDKANPDATNRTCAAETKNSSGKSVDQREIVTRPQGPRCDIGAFEATPDLGLTGSAKNNPITVGDQDTVTYVVGNSGPETAQDSTFTDPGAGHRIDSVSTSQGTCTHTTTTVSCHFGAIPTGGTVTVKIVLTGLTPGKIKLHGFTNTAGLDLNTKNNHATVTIKVKPKAKPVVFPPGPSISIAPLGAACHAEGSTIHIGATAKAPAGIRRLSLRVNLVGGGQTKAFGYAPSPTRTVKKKTVHLDVSGSSLLAGRTYSVKGKVVDKLNRSATDHAQFTMCKVHKKRGFTG